MALKIPPPVIFILSLCLIYVLSNQTYSSVTLILSCLIWVICAVIAVVAILPFKQQKTTIDPLYPQKTSQLITQGIYRFSRNPMYLSLIFGLVGWMVLWQSVWGILAIILAMLYLTEYQIKPEEQALKAKFGESFVLYQQQVRRWL